MGLDAILKFSVPVLNAIYPLAILLIILAFLRKALERFPAVYPFAAFFCGISSVLTVLEQQGLMFSAGSQLLHLIPAYEAGFGWALPTVIGALAGILWNGLRDRARAEKIRR